jgi:hypothetical protein
MLSTIKIIMAVIKRSGVVWYVQNGRMAKGRLEWQDRGMAEQRNGMAGSGNGGMA